MQTVASGFNVYSAVRASAPRRIQRRRFRPGQATSVAQRSLSLAWAGAVVAGGAWSPDAQAAAMPLISAANGQCIGVYGASPTQGAAIVQTACTGANGQQWKFQSIGAAFQLVTSGKCIAVSATSTSDGVPAVLSKCSNSDLQSQFDFRPLGPGYQIVARSSGKCLGPEGASLQDGARIVQQTCSDQSALQIWAPDADAIAVSSWTPLVALTLVPVAAAHLPNGKVMLWSATNQFTYQSEGGQTYTSLLDPATLSATETLVTSTGHDMFCPGIANLPDGRIHVSGGSNSQKTSLYDPGAGWTTGAPMNIARGYQGSVTLSNGGVLTYGGSWSGGLGSKTGEVWTVSGGWRVVSNLIDEALMTGDTAGVYRSDNHAWLFAASNGRVFHAGPSKTMHWLDTAGSGLVTAVGSRGTNDAMNGSAVMYDVGRILTFGGAPSYENTAATAEANLIDIRTGVAVRSVAPMAYARSFHSSVLLPSGQIVVIGGQAWPKVFTEDLAVLSPELWDPRTETFTRLAATSVPRVYHSVALLLPDARVLTGGGGLCGSCSTNHPDVQVLTPPYLLNPDGTAAVQPRITTAPSQAGLGMSVSVTTDVPVASFALVRMSSITHSVNNEQRRVPLAVAAQSSPTTYQLALPSDPGVVVPGYWMLFALTANGVPSKASIVKIG